ncbi:hypothetical protein DIPPA_52144 [Diplonema papillatum]|nr:hypothetical protein DIPPA_52144 [Diplonema papillatum]
MVLYKLPENADSECAVCSAAFENEEERFLCVKDSSLNFGCCCHTCDLTRDDCNFVLQVNAAESTCQNIASLFSAVLAKLSPRTTLSVQRVHEFVVCEGCKKASNGSAEVCQYCYSSKHSQQWEKCEAIDGDIILFKGEKSVWPARKVPPEHQEKSNAKSKGQKPPSKTVRVNELLAHVFGFAKDCGSDSDSDTELYQPNQLLFDEPQSLTKERSGGSTGEIVDAPQYKDTATTLRSVANLVGGLVGGFAQQTVSQASEALKDLSDWGSSATAPLKNCSICGERIPDDTGGDCCSRCLFIYTHVPYRLRYIIWHEVDANISSLLLAKLFELFVRQEFALAAVAVHIEIKGKHLGCKTCGSLRPLDKCFVCGSESLYQPLTSLISGSSRRFVLMVQDKTCIFTSEGRTEKYFQRMHAEENFQASELKQISRTLAETIHRWKSSYAVAVRGHMPFCKGSCCGACRTTVESQQKLQVSSPSRASRSTLYQLSSSADTTAASTGKVAIEQKQPNSGADAAGPPHVSVTADDDDEEDEAEWFDPSEGSAQPVQVQLKIEAQHTTQTSNVMLPVNDSPRVQFEPESEARGSERGSEFVGTQESLSQEATPRESSWGSGSWGARGQVPAYPSVQSVGTSLNDEEPKET